MQARIGCARPGEVRLAVAVEVPHVGPPGGEVAYSWLKSTLEKIAAGHPQSRLHELLPWYFDPASN